VPAGQEVVPHEQDPPSWLAVVDWQQCVSAHDSVVFDENCCPHRHEQSLVLSRLGKEQTYPLQTQSWVESFSLQHAPTELRSVVSLHWSTRFGSFAVTSVPQMQ
jgi:hypothetical protein